MPKKYDKRSDGQAKPLKKKPVKPKSKPKKPVAKRSDTKRSDTKRSDTKPVKPVTPVKQVAPKFSITKNKGCCTDVLKTGQAYTIPFGFKDRFGTQRIGEPDEPVARKLNEVVKPKMIDASSQAITIRVPKQPKPVMVSSGTDAIRPVMVDAGVGTRIPTETSISTVPADSMIPRIRKPTIRQDLEDRYERATGTKYKGKKLNNSEFLFVVEQAERAPSRKKI